MGEKTLDEDDVLHVWIGRLHKRGDLKFEDLQGLTAPSPWHLLIIPAAVADLPTPPYKFCVVMALFACFSSSELELNS